MDINTCFVMMCHLCIMLLMYRLCIKNNEFNEGSFVRNSMYKVQGREQRQEGRGEIEKK